MALEITAKLIKLFPAQTGVGKNGNWTKRDFLVETIETYPKKVCLNAWNEKAIELERFAIGDIYKISFNIESREFNERWYTDVRAWKIEPANNAGPSNQGYNASGNNFQTQSNNVVPENNSFPAPEEDDLPF